jgi:hypothetical protein
VLYLAIISMAYLFSGFQPFQQHVLASFYRIASHVAALLLLWIAYQGSAAPGSQELP